MRFVGEQRIGDVGYPNESESGMIGVCCVGDRRSIVCERRIDGVKKIVFVNPIVGVSQMISCVGCLIGNEIGCFGAGENSCAHQHFRA